MTYDEVADKFRGNAEFAKWPSQKAETVIELVKSLENAHDMSRLTAAVAGLSNPSRESRENQSADPCWHSQVQVPLLAGPRAVTG